MRLLALDQATRVTGWAIFEDDKLIKYGKIKTEDSNLGDRLHNLKNQVDTLICDNNIDEVAFEDIQYQKSVNGEENINNVQTFKALAEVFGVIDEYLTGLSVPHEAVLAATWKSTLKIRGRQREEQKRNAQAYVQNTYNIKCTQDEADAICIGTHMLIKKGLRAKPKDVTNLGEVGFDWSD